MYRPVRGVQTYAEDWADPSGVEEQRAVLDDALEAIEVRRGCTGRGLGTSRLTLRWRFPDEVGPLEEPSNEALAAWAHG